IITLLIDGIGNLEKDTDFVSLGKQDLIYKGNSENWIKMGYGLKARHTMRLSLISPDYANVIAFANESFTSASEQSQLVYNGLSSKSPFKLFFDDRDYFGSSTSLHNKLVERNDPRDSIFFKPHPDADDLLFAPNGTPDQAQGLYAISAISTITAPTYLLSYHEIEFLKAEAYARLGDLPNAKDALKKAIIAA